VTVYPGDHELDDAPPAVEHKDDWATDQALETLLQPQPAAFRSDLRRVVVRMQGGEEIEAGKAIGREAAVVIARELIAAIESSTDNGDWPELGDRFLRPGAIVSIDVQRAGPADAPADSADSLD
jgi:hypothetical protein